jgi:hypothetical protein
VAFAIVWLGYALLTERREQVSQSSTGNVSTRLRQSEAK